MPNFTYSARDNNGRAIEGKLEARDAQAVEEILQEEQESPGIKLKNKNRKLN